MESFSSRYGPWALIAGGSEGIGFSFAQQLAAKGINLILIARRDSALADAKASLIQAYNVQVSTHAVDLTAPNLEQSLNNAIADREIGLLVYNAGAQHGAELFVEDSLEKTHQLIALNCTGPALFCHTLGKAMRNRGRGGLILLSSMSGLAGSAYVTAYSAAKAFEINLAEGLWAELKPSGVDVLCLIAGATDTPAMAQSDIDINAGSTLGVSPMPPEEVAAEGLEQLANGPVHIAGESNRAAAEMFRSDRNQAIELLSFGAANMYGKPFPIT